MLSRMVQVSNQSGVISTSSCCAPELLAIWVRTTKRVHRVLLVPVKSLLKTTVYGAVLRIVS